MVIMGIKAINFTWNKMNIIMIFLIQIFLMCKFNNKKRTM